MRVKTLSYHVVWNDSSERKEDTVRCDETRCTDGERQFLRNGHVELAISVEELISYRKRETQFHTPGSISEWVEVAKMHYRDWRGKDPMPARVD